MYVKEIEVRYKTARAPLDPSRTLGSAADVVRAFQDLALEPVEVFRVLYLDLRHRPMCYKDVARGSVSSCPAHPREIFRMAVHLGATAILCLHNHPSGCPQPSGQDRQFTGRLRRAGQLLGIPLLDHIVLGADGEYYSFADRGELRKRNDRVW